MGRYACALTPGICLLFVASCTEMAVDVKYDWGARTTDGGAGFDTPLGCSDPTKDWDGDGITNGDEGCLSGRDTDGDKVPDWQDLDSDADKIPDHVEAGTKGSGGKCIGAKGAKSWPCDSDGDKVPDYLDQDSDGDGLKDGDEDENGDGQLGCCLTTCNKPGSTWQKSNCVFNTAGCGRGQKCVSGKCLPPVGFHCSEGETDPKKKSTFDDGLMDIQRGTFICRDATEDKPGRKAVQVRSDFKGDWKIALEKNAKYGLVTIAGAGKKMAAGVINHETTDEMVAGLVLSKTPTGGVQTELSALMSAIQSAVSGLGTVSVRASGIQGRSHDRYDIVRGTTLALELTSASDASSVRNLVLAAMLGKTMANLSNLPAPFTAKATKFVVRFSTVRRVAFKKDKNNKVVLDAKGYPVDSGDTSKWRLLVMGAVAATGAYHDPTKRTGFIADDLSDGTGLAQYVDDVGDECDLGRIYQLPMADIIWVMDESGSMDDNRNDIVNNANNFFSRALSSGLDFRMCVTNVVQPNGSYKATVGKCCSKISTSSTDDGGTDRFLLPSEQSIFSACVKNPPGYEGYAEYGLVNAKAAVTRHLPRVLNTPNKIRTKATLVIIVVTDEKPESLGSVITSSDYKTCTLASATQSKVNAALQPYMDLFTGISDPEGAAMFHVIGGVCNNTCSADVAHGYRELAQKLGGQWASICQKNLGNTLQLLIDSITGKASPITLDYIPISSSLAVALDAVVLKRSRVAGFDYRPATNTLVYININYKKGSEVITSYKRWERQIPPG